MRKEHVWKDILLALLVSSSVKWWKISIRACAAVERTVEGDLCTGLSSVAARGALLHVHHNRMPPWEQSRNLHKCPLCCVHYFMCEFFYQERETVSLLNLFAVWQGCLFVWFCCKWKYTKPVTNKQKIEWKPTIMAKSGILVWQEKKISSKKQIC